MSAMSGRHGLLPAAGMGHLDRQVHLARGGASAAHHLDETRGRRAQPAQVAYDVTR